MTKIEWIELCAARCIDIGMSETLAEAIELANICWAADQEYQHYIDSPEMAADVNMSYCDDNVID